MPAGAPDLLKRKAVTPLDVQYGLGACYDLFFVPSPARWSGDERAAYELVSRRIDEAGDAVVVFT